MFHPFDKVSDLASLSFHRFAIIAENRKNCINKIIDISFKFCQNKLSKNSENSIPKKIK